MRQLAESLLFGRLAPPLAGQGRPVRTGPGRMAATCIMLAPQFACSDDPTAEHAVADAPPTNCQLQLEDR
jgi:hypothetical protein